MNLATQPSQLLPERINAGSVQATLARPTLLCLSHLRWGFVYQRPQHVMSHLSKHYDVLFFEEPIFTDAPDERLEASSPVPGITLLVPHLPHGLDQQQIADAQRVLLDDYLTQHVASELLLWYLTPMSLMFTEHLKARVTIFDCMDELSAFKGAPPDLLEKERQLMARADVVFTGGHSLWEAKREHHRNVYSLPSSVDIAHFATARQALPEPADQAGIGHPRLGFFGVIDERFDIALVDELAAQRPDWQVVIIGPVVKIDPGSLPRRPNIHYLGGKGYPQLPAYLSGWDVALMPFAINESTRFISPTKTPEYLAGGCPVVSTPVCDVVRGYGGSGVVTIAESAGKFILAIEAALIARQDDDFLLRIDRVLEGMSWDATCSAMRGHIECLR